MEYNKETDQWIGTPIEHLQKLLETHDCMCNKVRKVLHVIIDGESEIVDKEKNATAEVQS